MDLPLWNTEHIVEVTLKHNRSWKFYASAIRNHILLFSAFLETFLITTFLKNPVGKFEFSVVRRKLKFLQFSVVTTGNP